MKYHEKVTGSGRKKI